MCRLYGFLASDPTHVECGLVHAYNSLLAQSRRDRRGRSNADGWGVAYYSSSFPILRKQTIGAAEDSGFVSSAASIRTHAIVAHVRAATVGKPRFENTHPFVLGRWAFAHNGTVADFEDRARRLLVEIPRWLLAERRGNTDSELLFLWILSRLEYENPGATLHGVPDGVTLGILEEALRAIISWDAEPSSSSTSSLNIVLTDGRSLFAVRRGRTLYSLERDHVHGCELCERCRCPVCSHATWGVFGTPPPRLSFVVASEPITSERWQEVEDHTLVYATEGRQVRRLKL